MRSFFSVALIFTILCISAPAITQEEQAEPTFPSISGLMYETYKGIDRPAFNKYFELMVEKFEGNPDARWSIWNENMSVAYRITGLPEGLRSVELLRKEGMSVLTGSPKRNVLFGKRPGRRARFSFIAPSQP